MYTCATVVILNLYILEFLYYTCTKYLHVRRISVFPLEPLSEIFHELHLVFELFIVEIREKEYIDVYYFAIRCVISIIYFILSLWYCDHVLISMLESCWMTMYNTYCETFRNTKLKFRTSAPSILKRIQISDKFVVYTLFLSESCCITTFIKQCILNVRTREWLVNL